ncbi:hypothetical protein QQ056_17145 [Oscillatoria laete-virens NRMC-F 0139]|nr:hypothetical protein [Oscillatoria laete-virens]MDL5055259.1 hypothetical protein [Oscillatoria laete-virens NRMC-F 0139]
MKLHDIDYSNPVDLNFDPRQNIHWKPSYRAKSKISGDLVKLLLSNIDEKKYEQKVGSSFNLIRQMICSIIPPKKRYIIYEILKRDLQQDIFVPALMPIIGEDDYIDIMFVFKFYNSFNSFTAFKNGLIRNFLKNLIVNAQIGLSKFKKITPNQSFINRTRYINSKSIILEREVVYSQYIIGYLQSLNKYYDGFYNEYKKLIYEYSGSQTGIKRDYWLRRLGSVFSKNYLKLPKPLSDRRYFK